MQNELDPHKQFVKQTFDTVAEAYDNPSQRYFQFCADQLLSFLQPRPGSRLLDIATGTGAAALAAAQRLGRQGRVHAIDISQRMLDKAFTNLRASGLENTDFHLMDAEQLEFKSNYFDYATCSFGVFFLPDMPAAVKEWLRVLKPGGTLLFTTFTEQAFHPQAELFKQGIEAQGVPFPATSWRRLASEADCAGLLEQAGFTDITVTRKQMGYHLRNEQDWWEILRSSGFRGILDKLDPDQQAAFRQQHLAAVQKLITDQGLWLDVETLFASGKKTGTRGG